MVLSLGKLAAGPAAGRYYSEAVASGREDYYASHGETAGRWAGGPAAELGLVGEVGGDQLERLLAGEDPRDGSALRASVARRSVAGFDLTFRAPKSVSVLWAIADREAARVMTAGHEAAVDEALRYLEAEACWARRGRGGCVSVRGAGLLSAAFRHRTSRAGDPLLHTHVVVANTVQGPDGRWTALDARHLYAHHKTAGFVYQAELRRQLTDRLGLQWTEPVNGMADVKGIDREVIEHFSRRKAEIEQALAEHGTRSGRAREKAALATRARKAYNVDHHQLQAEWRARAAEHGLDAQAVDWLLARRGTGRDREAVDELFWDRALEGGIDAEHLGVESLVQRSSTFARQDVIRAFANASHDGASLHELKAHADRSLARPAIADLGEGRYSTHELLQAERDLLAGATDRQHEGTAIANHKHLTEAIAQRPTLSDEQRQVVEQLTTSGHGIEVVRAAAGTGKTFSLDAAHQAWRQSGIEVRGCALAARAACELRDQTGIPSTTIAATLRDLRNGAHLPPDGVLVVDESGMVGTRDLHALAQAAHHTKTKLVLVGDDRQLPEIDAGGAFRALATQAPSHELTETRRQQHGWDRQALAELRDGDLETFAAAYTEHGRIHSVATAETARSQLVADWHTARQDGHDALMLANRRSDVRDLNDRARHRLRHNGDLPTDDLVTTANRAYAHGDQVIGTHNHHTAGLLNGQRATVTALTPHGLELDTGHRTVVLPIDELDAHLDHGYATTCHRAQGATVDHTYVLGTDELYREWAYTALSRHRHQAHFYAVRPHEYLNSSAIAPDHALPRALGRRQQDNMASDYDRGVPR